MVTGEGVLAEVPPSTYTPARPWARCPEPRHREPLRFHLKEILITTSSWSSYYNQGDQDTKCCQGRSPRGHQGRGAYICQGQGFAITMVEAIPPPTPLRPRSGSVGIPWRSRRWDQISSCRGQNIVKVEVPAVTKVEVPMFIKAKIPVSVKVRASPSTTEVMVLQSPWSRLCRRLHH